jgi:HlyD family secretion protein
VFDLQPTARGFVANTAEPVLKIVPGDNLVARVFLTNKDIGFVEEGMQVDVRIDSFPFSEFGDIKGELVSIGSDALPPTEVRPYYSFPAEIRLDKQSLEVNGREVPLQSGMSVSTNILVRKRTVLSIFTDLFTEKTESLKKVR